MSPGERRHGSAAAGGATRPVVGLLGLFGVGNLGNDGSLEVGLEMVREFAPDADVVCITPSPRNIAERYGVATLRMREPAGLPSWLLVRGALRLVVLPLAEVSRWFGTYRTARRLGVVVVPGTGVLDDFGLRPQTIPYILFRWALACRLARTPFAFVGIGAGPIKNPTSRRLMAWTARLATHRSYRDAGSIAYMAELGAPGHFTPDVVFADRRLVPDAEHDDVAVPGTIGVGVMSYAGWSDGVADTAGGGDHGADTGDGASRDYLGRIVDLVGRLLDDGRRVTLVTGTGSDLNAVDRVVSALEASGRSLEGRLHRPKIQNLGDVCRALAGTDGAIVTRYHSLVCALIARRACVPTGYESRFDELLESVGLSGFGHRAASFEVEQVLADLSIAAKERCERQQDVAERLVEFDDLVRRDFAAVFADLSADASADSSAAVSVGV